MTPDMSLDISILPELVNKDLNDRATVHEQSFLWNHVSFWKSILEEKQQQIEAIREQFQQEYARKWNELSGTPYDEQHWDNYVEDYKHNLGVADEMLLSVKKKLEAIAAQGYTEETTTEEHFAMPTIEISPLDFVPDYLNLEDTVQDFTLFHQNWHYGYFWGMKKCLDYFVWLTKQPGIKQHEIIDEITQFIDKELRPWIETERSIPSFDTWRKEQETPNVEQD